MAMTAAEAIKSHILANWLVTSAKLAVRQGFQEQKFFSQIMILRHIVSEDHPWNASRPQQPASRMTLLQE